MPELRYVDPHIVAPIDMSAVAPPNLTHRICLFGFDAIPKGSVEVRGHALPLYDLPRINSVPMFVPPIRFIENLPPVLRQLAESDRYVLLDGNKRRDAVLKSDRQLPAVVFSCYEPIDPAAYDLDPFYLSTHPYDTTLRLYRATLLSRSGIPVEKTQHVSHHLRIV